MERAFEKRHAELEAQTGFQVAIHSDWTFALTNILPVVTFVAFVNCALARAHVQAYVYTKFSLLFAIQIATLSACRVRERKREKSRSLVALSNCWLTVLLRLCWADYAQRENGGQFKLNLFFETRFSNNLNEPFNSRNSSAKSHWLSACY